MRALVSWSPSGGQPGQPSAAQPPSQQQVWGHHTHTLSVLYCFHWYQHAQVSLNIESIIGRSLLLYYKDGTR